MTAPAPEANPPLPKHSARADGWRFTALVSFLLLSLLMLSDITRNPTRFGELYTPLIGLTVVALVVLCGLFVRDTAQIAREFRAKRPGARLTARMVAIFAFLAVTPVMMIYFFSMQFLYRSVDNWLDIRIEQALEGALELTRDSLDRNMRERLKQIELLSVQLSDLTEPDAADRLHDTFEMLGASELTLISSKGRVIAASANTTALVPIPPDEAVLLQVRQGDTYIGLDASEELGPVLRVVASITHPAPGQEARFIQALFPFAKPVSEIETDVQTAFASYRELIHLREPLRTSFMLTASLVLLVSLLGAVWAAVFAARRLTAPLRLMADLALRVAEGKYETRIADKDAGEIDFLVSSFNEMTSKLAVARDDARDSHRQLDEQRAYFKAVLSRLSSGVLTTGHDRRLVTFNQMAKHILDTPLEKLDGQPLDLLRKRDPRIAPFVRLAARRILAAQPDWREEVEMEGPRGRQILMCRGTVLHGLHRTGPGHVIVFDDITRLIEAQRSQAWEEVARRLAHEIKNPLTPIQLSAERLRQKYLARMEGSEGESLDRLTRTIVHQVESLKEMVNAFSKYARTPARRARLVDVNELVSDVAELYRGEDGRGAVRLELTDSPACVNVDPGQFRQVLHNLIRNADEALANRKEDSEDSDGRVAGGIARGSPKSDPPIIVGTRRVVRNGREYVETRIDDRGPGIDGAVSGRLFEPYVSTKPRGTGIGLAIVKKIVEEHDGEVKAENRVGGGAHLAVLLPAATPKAGPMEKNVRSAPGPGHG